MKIVLVCMLSVPLTALSNPCDDLIDAARKSDLQSIYANFSGCASTGNLHFGWNALHEAANNYRLDALQVLLEMGMDVNAQDGNGWTPLHVAAAKGFYIGAQFLLSKGAYILPDAAGDFAWEMSKSAKHKELTALIQNWAKNNAARSRH